MRTVGELKAFIEGMDIEEGKAPTAKQWNRLIRVLEEVESNQILDLLNDGTTARKMPYTPQMPPPTFIGGPDLTLTTFTSNSIDQNSTVTSDASTSPRLIAV